MIDFPVLLRNNGNKLVVMTINLSIWRKGMERADDGAGRRAAGRVGKRAEAAGAEGGEGLKDSTAVFNELVEETTLLFHRLRDAAERVHGAGELSGGRRGVLLWLERAGAQTVPQLARGRTVSRQHMQMVVNDLLKDGYVELVSNPAHKRSPIVRLTSKGEDYIAEMRDREREMHRRIELGIGVEQMRAASMVLSRLRERMASDEWAQAAAIVCPQGAPKRLGRKKRK